MPVQSCKHIHRSGTKPAMRCSVSLDPEKAQHASQAKSRTSYQQGPAYTAGTKLTNGCRSLVCTKGGPQKVTWQQVKRSTTELHAHTQHHVWHTDPTSHRKQTAGVRANAHNKCKQHCKHTRRTHHLSKCQAMSIQPTPRHEGNRLHCSPGPGI
jgi:hypothetical protein